MAGRVGGVQQAAGLRVMLQALKSCFACVRWPLMRLRKAEFPGCLLSPALGRVSLQPLLIIRAS